MASAETADQLRKDRLALGSTPGNLEVSRLPSGLRCVRARSMPPHTQEKRDALPSVGRLW